MNLYYGNAGRMILGPYTGTDLRAMAFGRAWLAQPGNGGPSVYGLRAASPRHAASKLAAHLARQKNRNQPC